MIDWNKPKKFCYVVYKCCERKYSHIATFKTIVEAHEFLRNQEYKVQTQLYDLKEYLELQEYVWTGTRWEYYDVVGVYETVGSSAKMKAVKNRIESEYNRLAKFNGKTKEDKK